MSFHDQHIQSVALIPHRGLGDALIWMVLANNLERNNIKVTMYSDILQSMSHWFPHIVIAARPKIELDVQAFKQFSFILGAEAEITAEIKKVNHNWQEIHKHDFPQYLSLVDNLVTFCKHQLKLKDVIKENGIRTPANLVYRRYPQRVVIHPTSTDTEKNWSADKFLALAAELEKLGYLPVFTVAPHEYADWQQMIQNQYTLLQFPTVNDLAAYVYESGWMIGNDSGVGHLASCLHIPTVSIFHPHGNAASYWRPGWGKSEVVTAWLPLPKPLRKYWRSFISVRQVLDSFKKLHFL